MKTKSLEKLACLKEQSAKDELEKAKRWQKAAGYGPAFSERESGAFEVGFNAGWQAALQMIALHNLK